MTTKFSLSTFLLILAAFATMPGFAAAYIDPGSGSIILQFLLGMIFGAILFFKLMWQRLKAAISGLFSSNSGNSTEE